MKSVLLFWRVIGGASLIGTALMAGRVASVEGAVPLEHLRALLIEHHYHQVLTATSQALNLSDREMRKQDFTRYDLECVRGEALIGLHIFSQAIEAYQAAAHAARNDREERIARATAALISHSSGGDYVAVREQGRSITRIKISIVGTSQRLAMKAFSKHEWKIVQRQVAPAERSATLGRTIELLSPLRLAVDLQTAADAESHGVASRATSRKSKPLPAEAAVDAVSQHMVTRIHEGLQAMQKTVARIGRTEYIRTRGRQHRRPGITPAQFNTLATIVTTCQRVQNVVTNFDRKFADFPKNVAACKPLLVLARKVEATARRQLPAGN